MTNLPPWESHSHSRRQPAIFKFPHFDIQSTGQKSKLVNNLTDHHNDLNSFNSRNSNVCTSCKLMFSLDILPMICSLRNFNDLCFHYPAARSLCLSRCQLHLVEVDGEYRISLAVWNARGDHLPCDDSCMHSFFWIQNIRLTAEQHLARWKWNSRFFDADSFLR